MEEREREKGGWLPPSFHCTGSHELILECVRSIHSSLLPSPLLYSVSATIGVSAVLGVSVTGVYDHASVCGGNQDSTVKYPSVLGV